ncbi:uncharacterized protein [Clytia hemisphaerica]|uniref:uncharacterized protein n=1 Tax=Clytia hemisphaerica TaxID=252671 RepID=UPI0034D58BEB|eukprot:TCONS_00060317-protein
MDALFLKVLEELNFEDHRMDKEFKGLVLYVEGSYYKQSTKDDKLCATLIVQLPSVFTGGDLVIYRGGKSETIQFDRKESRYEMVYAAHYADCQHEVTPLTSGYRLALVYKLIQLPPSDEEIQRLKIKEKTINQFKSILTQDGARDKVVGWSLRGLYDQSLLYEGFFFNEEDDEILQALQEINKGLHKEQQFSFYVFKIENNPQEPNKRNPYDPPFERYRWFDYDGEKCDLSETTFDVEHDLVDFQSRFNRDAKEFWEEDVDILLAVPKKLELKVLCKSQETLSHDKKKFKRGRDLLLEMFDSSVNSVAFKDDLMIFVAKFDSVCYHYEPNDAYDLDDAYTMRQSKEEVQENLNKIVQMLTHVANIDLTRLFIQKIVSSVMPDAKPLAELLETVPWEVINNVVIKLISNSQECDYEKWLLVAEYSRINDIANKVIELSLKTVEKKTADETRWISFATLWAKIFTLLFENEELSNCWWEKVSSTSHFIENISFLSQVCSELPYSLIYGEHKEPTICGGKPLRQGYSTTEISKAFPNASFNLPTTKNQEKLLFLLKCIVLNLRTATSRTYLPDTESLFYKALKPSLEHPKAKHVLEDILKIVVKEGQTGVIGEILVHCADEKEKLVCPIVTNGFLVHSSNNGEKHYPFEIGNLNLFIDLFLTWMRDTGLEETHFTKIASAAKLLFDNEKLDFSTVRSERFLCLLHKIRSPNLLCRIISVLASTFKIKENPCLLNCLLESFIDLSTSTVEIKELPSIVVFLMRNSESCHRHLTKFVSSEHVTGSLNTLEKIVIGLKDEVQDDFKGWQSSESLKQILIAYTRLLQNKNGSNPNLKAYKFVVEFLFNVENFPLSNDILCQLFNIESVKENVFDYLDFICSLRPTCQTDTYKQFLHSGVDLCSKSFGKVEGITKSVSSKCRFVKHLLSDESYFDIALRFSRLTELQTNDFANIYSPYCTVLAKLIKDLKLQYVNTEFYANLIQARVKSLQMLKNEGPPEFSWKQPYADFDEEINAFLHSGDEFYVFEKKVITRQEGKDWVEWMKGSHVDVKLGYNFIAWDNESTAYGVCSVKLQKGVLIHEERARKYNIFMEELEELLAKLKTTDVYCQLGMKRHLSDQEDSSPTKKKVMS